MENLLQRLIVFLNVSPCHRLFRAVYAWGLRRVLKRLIRHPAVHSVYGAGSFFDGRCLYGYSDIDLIIVIKESYPREDGVEYQLWRIYNPVRRSLPFLSAWSEIATNLIFLEDVKVGLPLPVSFETRRKLGRLVLLHGDPLSFDNNDKTVRASEVLAEVNGLLKAALLTPEVQVRRLLFWKFLFLRLLDLAEVIDLPLAKKASPAGSAFPFLIERDRTLFFCPAEPEELFPEFLSLAARLWTEIREREESVNCEYHGSLAAAIPAVSASAPVRLQALAFAAGADTGAVRALPSFPIGLTPHLFFFPVGVSIPLVDLEGNSYRDPQRLKRAMLKQAGVGEGLLIRAKECLFLLCRQKTYLELVPLDPVLFGNVYALLAGKASFAMPQSVLDDLVCGANQWYNALARRYQQNEGWVRKVSFPCIYREDDLETIDQAFSILRSHLACPPRQLWLGTVDELVDYYRERHPECDSFLTDLLATYRFLQHKELTPPSASNLYRCLHQFMVQVLTGASTIILDDPRKKLGITVGIITRNRARDLRRALKSLTHLRRPGDEVIIVDNGSSDDTRAVSESYKDVLPLRYLYLKDPSIPRARNLVIQQATQEVIAFTDDDAAVDPGWLNAIERAFLRADNVGVVGGWVEHWPADHQTMVDTYYELFHTHKP
jgi:hypothetical protein